MIQRNAFIPSSSGQMGLKISEAGSDDLEIDLIRELDDLLFHGARIHWFYANGTR